jgi:hypothetical protein
MHTLAFPSDAEIAKALNNREELASQMTQAQVEEGQEMAQQCRENQL